MGNTSLHAQLSLAVEQPRCGDTCDPSIPTPGCTPHAPLCTMKVVLADTPAFQLPLATKCTISLLQPNKVSLTLTISECPLSNGLFEASSLLVNEAEVKAQLATQSGDRLLSQSLATGKPFDVKFLAPSTRSTPGNTGELLPTYAWLSVLEEHVDMTSSVLRENWIKALEKLGDTDAKHHREIACPRDCDYEQLDSDYEDEDEASSAHCDLGRKDDLAAPEGQQSESGTESTGSPLSSFEPLNQPEEFIKCSEEPLLTPDYERTVWVKFAAHRTWHAFLWYCYTGNIEFCKLKSQVEPGGRHLRVTSIDSEDGPPTCSPKSMYRLADLLGNKDLKAKALAAIKKRMTEANVLDETFSVFASRYPDVRDVQLGVLKKHIKSPKVKEAFLRAMEKYGSTPHVKPVLSAFYDNLVV